MSTSDFASEIDIASTGGVVEARKSRTLEYETVAGFDDRLRLILQCVGEFAKDWFWTTQNNFPFHCFVPAV
jgi:hypothetical protein